MSDFPWTDSEPPAGEIWNTARLFARVFSEPGGEDVLAHLRRITVERTLPPEASAEALRDLEGQRRIVKFIEAQILRGRQ